MLSDHWGVRKTPCWASLSFNSVKLHNVSSLNERNVGWQQKLDLCWTNAILFLNKTKNVCYKVLH